jgi:hypothetical protein
MYYSVNVDRNIIAFISPEVTEGLSEVLYIECSEQDWWYMLRNGSEEDGNVRSECEDD